MRLCLAILLLCCAETALQDRATSVAPYRLSTPLACMRLDWVNSALRASPAPTGASPLPAGLHLRRSAPHHKFLLVTTASAHGGRYRLAVVHLRPLRGLSVIHPCNRTASAHGGCPTGCLRLHLRPLRGLSVIHPWDGTASAAGGGRAHPPPPPPPPPPTCTTCTTAAPTRA
jgi:hypothetical protein